MTVKMYDVVATPGKYTRNGETHYVNKRVGAVLKMDDGHLRLAMDADFSLQGLPRTERGTVFLSLFPPREDERRPAQQQAQQPAQSVPPSDDFDDDIPF